MRKIAIDNEGVSRLNRAIEEVTFQRNLLALHTALEAACGETAAQFAAVADAVGNLAQQGRRAVAAVEPGATSLGNTRPQPSRRRFSLDRDEPEI